MKLNKQCRILTSHAHFWSISGLSCTCGGVQDNTDLTCTCEHDGFLEFRYDNVLLITCAETSCRPSSVSGYTFVANKPLYSITILKFRTYNCKKYSTEIFYGAGNPVYFPYCPGKWMWYKAVKMTQLF